MAISRDKLKALHADALEALQAVAAKHGVAITPGSSTYGEIGKLGFTVLSIVNGAVESAERARFKACPPFDLEEGDLGRSFTIGPVTYTLEGCTSTGKLVVGRNGKLYTIRWSNEVVNAIKQAAGRG